MEKMEKRFHTLTIVVYEKESAYKQVNELLHNFGEKILLRTGYPIRENNTAIIFLIVQMTNNELGSLSGKLGQLENVKVNTMTLKI